MSDTCGCGCRHSATAAPDVVGATVEDVVRQSPQAAEVLRRFGIDTCCGGRLTLAQAAAAAGASVDVVLADLDAGSKGAA